jgi:CheY-like chemotaxis protein
VILGFAQVMETSDLDEEDSESVEHIIKAGRHLLDLINEVLDLSRIESGTLTISPEPVLADELVSDTLDLIRPAARDRHIDIVETAETCEAFVRADRQRFKQVLLNVLSNAVKYNRDGGKIFVSCSRGEEDLQIKIRDTGPGIPTAFMDKLFEPFERLGAEALKVEGTGLGLSLSRQLVEVMGGTIDATNSDEGGAEFTIELPLDTSPAVALEEVGARSEQGDVSIERPGRTILLIEDNLTNLRLVERILRSRPEVALIPAMQGQLGLELAREHNPDLILLDLHLPDLSGFEVLNRLRADPRTRGSPVVVVSADASPGQVRRLLDAGAAEYLTKPLELTRFFETLDAILGPETAPSKARSGREP